MPPSEVKKIEDKLDRLLFIVDNDQGTGKKGLVAQVEELKSEFYKFVNNYNLEMARRKGAMAVWALIGGALWTGFLWVIQKVASHFV